MTRARIARAFAPVAACTVLLAGCASEPRAEEPSPAAETRPAAAHPEQALLEELTLANRMLAETAVLDGQGHVTARSRVNPDHYYIARYLSPGGVSTSDFIENDLDSQSVHGPRNDQARETHLHGQIYKARPDVMAIVHAHTAEFVAFGMSSVPLWNGQTKAPVWDIRQFNNGRSGIVSTPELGRAMAATLGQNEAVLLWGHGIALTAGSIEDVVSRVLDLRESARLQQATIAMGGRSTPRAPTDDAATRDRTWEYLKRTVLKKTGGRVPTSPPPDPVKPADPIEAARRDLVLANRILASEELAVLTTPGHVSIRHPQDANRYLIAPGVAAGAVAAQDVIERSTADAEAGGADLSIHGEVYRARPDVMAVLYARTPEVVAFSHESMKLRPVVNGGAFLRDGLPILANPGPGQVAAALGKRAGVFLAGQAFVLTAPSVYELANRAYALRLNATIQRQAMALRGKVAYLDEMRVPPAPANAPGGNAPLGPPEGRAWVYWSQNVSLD
ncbi:MAG: class II aldolase/adducin family protein [Acidobacteria bacterium]|nr:class II aldolase/adducin family protein [Acidobacteriota bacterium]